MNRILLVLCCLLITQTSYAENFIQMNDKSHTILNLSKIDLCQNLCGYRRDDRKIYYRIGRYNYWLNYYEDNYNTCVNDYKRLSGKLLRK